MLTSFLPIFLAILIAFTLAAIISLLAGLLGPHKPDRHKNEPYECGIVPDKPVLEKFDIRYYAVALLFLAFDVEVIFIYPWAAASVKLGVFGFNEMLISVAILMVGYFFAIRNGIFNWNPHRHGRVVRDDNPWDSRGMP